MNSFFVDDNTSSFALFTWKITFGTRTAALRCTKLQSEKNWKNILFFISHLQTDLWQTVMSKVCEIPVNVFSYYLFRFTMVIWTSLKAIEFYLGIIATTWSKSFQSAIKIVLLMSTFPCGFALAEPSGGKR